MQKAKMTLMAVLTTALLMVWVTPLLAGDTGKVNINTASVEELMELDGIGQTYAKRIVDFREKSGEFQHPEDILKVKGIGEKIFDANQERIVVQDE